MVDIFDIEIPSLVKGKTRRAFVYLPENYGNGRRFPVMYMFDGHNLFSDSDATYGKSWGLADYLDKTNTPLIIASVECNHEGNSRLSEYSPVDFTFKNGEKIKGRGKKYMDWLQFQADDRRKISDPSGQSAHRCRRQLDGRTYDAVRAFKIQ